jgi:tRNA(fMet)-specific endonuclease VapC
MSFLQRADSAQGARLRERLQRLAPEHRGTTIIRFEEQMRGWIAYLSKARQMVRQIEAYQRLHQFLRNYAQMLILDFTELAAVEFQRLARGRQRIGTMDLKIAAIALAHDATPLTRNLRDFRKIEGLKAEDWTI